jgi:hypothetical protein
MLLCVVQTVTFTICCEQERKELNGAALAVPAGDTTSSPFQIRRLRLRAWPCIATSHVHAQLCSAIPGTI